MGQVTVCNVKGVKKNNSHQSLQLTQAIESVVVSFGSLFWFYRPQLYCFGSF